jgi:hypothetical protein
MADLAIRVENLGKLYRIGKAQERYPTLRDVLANACTASVRRLRSAFQRSNGHIWALKDVAF